MFSPNRESIPENALSHIGLFWRADTQFCSAMRKRNVPEDVWESAFGHLAALILGIEVLDSLDSIALSRSGALNPEDVENIDFGMLQSFDDKLPSTAHELRKTLNSYLLELITWVSDVRKAREPNFLPGKSFVSTLITILQEQLSVLSKSTFFVYLDEYENLCDYQKRIINTWLKHSEVPLIFNLAMKRNAFITNKETVGAELLSDIHDYRVHDLEEYLDNDAYPIFAAEILFLHLSLTEYDDIPIDVNMLRDPDLLVKRKEKIYIENILGAAQSLFPDISLSELARLVFQDKALYSKLNERIQQALAHRKSDITSNRFIKPDFAEASIVNQALLYRNKLQPGEIMQEMDMLAEGKDNRYTGDTDWIHNNFVGCLLQLYSPYSRACPFYAGFKTFCKLSRGSIRHFLELCHNSIYRAIDDVEEFKKPVDYIRQAEAASQASATFLREIKSFGPLGNQLHAFVLRLGSLFALAHRRPSQSESEQSHFSIKNGRSPLTAEDNNFLLEAVKWSVLFEHSGTKKKAEYMPQTIEYVLNPIYTPYFHISYRKKRKLELSTDEVISLIRGDLNEVTTLLKQYATSWFVDPNEAAPVPLSLFE
ncbi:MAG: hypothetical protein ACLQF0_11515 [Dissulfurispiraceae bacterium]